MLCCIACHVVAPLGIEPANENKSTNKYTVLAITGPMRDRNTQRLWHETVMTCTVTEARFVVSACVRQRIEKNGGPVGPLSRWAAT